MLIGEFQYNIDDKGRVFIPSKFRDDLGGCFVVTIYLDGCLAAYSLQEWRGIEERMRSQPATKSRNLARTLFAQACAVEPDKQGRIVIPIKLRKYACLQHEIMIIGASNHAEIWDKKKWDELSGSITAETLAETMQELGF